LFLYFTAQTQTLDKKYDSIIVGSGAGGLSAALCLARAGQNILLLEQHDVPGGWCHSFTLNGQLWP
jgi:all-trans-retinol 13,14-reductase